MNQQRKRKKKAKKTKITRKPKVPLLPNETTLATLRQWMRDSADNAIIKTLRISDWETKELLDAVWKGKEPRPTPNEMVALIFLSTSVGKTGNKQDTWVSVILPLLSLAPELHPYIKLNIKKGTFQLDERIKVVDRRGESNTEIPKGLEINQQKQ